MNAFFNLKSRGIIIFLFSILPIIDSVNGYFYGKGTSIGLLYKLCCICFLLFDILKKKYINIKIMYILLISSIYLCFTCSINGILFNFKNTNNNFAMRFFINILLLALLLQENKNKTLDGQAFYEILNNNTWLMTICFLGPYSLGLGKAIHAGNIGYKAFFYSQNELSATLVILFSFCLYKVICYSKLVVYIQFVLIVACMLLMNSKASIIASALGIVLAMFEYLGKNNGKNKSKKIIVIVIGSMAFYVLDGIQFVSKAIQNMMIRNGSLYKMYGYSVIATITSGRASFLKAAWKNLIDSKYLIFHALFGNGFYGNILIEMDFFDLFFYIGMVGCSVVILFVMYIFIKCKKNFKKDKSIIRYFCFWLIFAFSFLVGHVLFMSTAGFYLALYLCFNLSYDGEIKIVESKSETGTEYCKKL